MLRHAQCCFVALVTVITTMMIGSCFAYTDTSNGTGGIPCGNRLCATGANCTTNLTCACEIAPYTGGNGYIKCVTANFYSSFVLNDPLLRTYDNEHADVVIPCRYDMTEFTTNFLDASSTPQGICSTHVRAFNRKNKGKFYLHGFDAAIRVTFFNGTLFKMSVRKFGFAENGTYHYQVNASTDIYNVDGPFNDDQIHFYDPGTGLSIVECTIDKENNIAIINVTHCGVCIYYRPYDVILKRNQTHVPGLGIGIDQAHGPHFVNNGNMLALIPKDQHNAVAMADLPVKMTNTIDILYRAFLGNIPQIQPDPNGWCDNTTVTFTGQSMLTVRIIFSSCLWILKSPKFIRCYDPTENGERIMQLFDECARVFTNSYTCGNVQMSILDSGCKDKDPTNILLTKFLMSSNCVIS